MKSESEQITLLLAKWQTGDSTAAEDLMPMVYKELRRLAKRYMARERPNHTLQTTALVHEAFLQIQKMDISWQDRGHFMAVAATAMRRILVDHARSNLADKRGGGAVKVELDAALTPAVQAESTIVELDEALKKLNVFDSRKCQIVELHYFAGLSQEEVAALLSISTATVSRELRMAKAWLHQELTTMP